MPKTQWSIVRPVNTKETAEALLEQLPLDQRVTSCIMEVEIPDEKALEIGDKISAAFNAGQIKIRK